MSRSGYSDDCENLYLYRQAVDRAIHGRRGQAFLHEMLVALDALEAKRLGAGALLWDGDVCALGAVCRTRGLALEDVGPRISARKIGPPEYTSNAMAKLFGIAPALAAEIMFLNDERVDSPEKRYEYMRRWIVQQIEDHERREQYRVDREKRAEVTK